MNKIAVLILILFSGACLGAKTPTNGKVDPRIKHINYSEKDVYVIHGHYGYSSHIIFSPNERIMHVSPGDSIAWQISPKKNHIFLQPIEDNADTNLSVLTNKRLYNFELNAHEAKGPHDKTLSFVIKFNYPQDELNKKLAKENRLKQESLLEISDKIDPESLNFNYTMRGEQDIAPTRVFDDGEFTYFQFDESIDTPAIFLVDKNKKESIINYHIEGSYIVVHRTAVQFILRDDDQAICIYNEAKLAKASIEKSSDWMDD